MINGLCVCVCVCVCVEARARADEVVLNRDDNMSRLSCVSMLEYLSMNSVIEIVVA